VDQEFEAKPGLPSETLSQKNFFFLFSLGSLLASNW
jgi:hypothetical protein